MTRLALAAQPEFEDFQANSAWSQTIDHDELPFFAVATPREGKDKTTHSNSTRQTTLVVVLKILGGDGLEDELDALSIVVENVVITALENSERDCDLSETSVDLDGNAGSRVGTLSMKFTVTIWPLEPITD
jgi:hypothetical protein